MADRQKMLEELMQHPIKADDPFEFRCKQCGKCCRDRNDILLSPFDLCRMAKGLGEPLHEVLKKYGFLYVGEISKVPLVALKMRADNGKCQFLKEDNHCRIQMDKPVVCALFPLGRCATREKDRTDIFYILQPIECGAYDEIHTPREWMREFNLEESEEWFFIWQEIVATLSEKLRELLPKFSDRLVDEILSSIGGILYTRYDLEQPLIPQVKENGTLAMKMISNIEELAKQFGY